MQVNITAEFEDRTIKTFMAGKTFIEGTNEAATVRKHGKRGYSWPLGFHW